ncbi:MAG TPA: hypothetical protein VGB86_10275 [Methylomirabilota bacterium]|jgi:hypothetical protein
MSARDWKWERQQHGIVPSLAPAAREAIAVLLEEAGLGAAAGAARAR